MTDMDVVDFGKNSKVCIDTEKEGGGKIKRGDLLTGVKGGELRVDRKELIDEVNRDYLSRRNLRRQFEAQWQLNTNFVLGNQYSYINVNGKIEEGEKDYFWQEKEVFNHIAPILETRLAKLGRVRPKMSVRPASGDDNDILSSKAASKILNSSCSRLELDNLIATATMWSELTGSVFYKIVWDAGAGKTVGSLNGKSVKEGDIRVDLCPPYEILPDMLDCQSVEDCDSIIHCKAMRVADVKRIWGVDADAEELELLYCNNVNAIGGGAPSSLSYSQEAEMSENCIVIERYTRPSPDKPDGELAIVAGGQLLFYGALPYINGYDGERALPFVKQESLAHAGCFYGISIIERAIPIQRAYNAVKNRKHEFMNRIAMGVLAVEDGSVDTSNLEDEGLCPGKILVYRQGSSPPQLLDTGRVPSDFGYEEDRLLSEFIAVSGVSEIMRNSSAPTSVTSGVALQLLVEQDDTRLSVTAEFIRGAVRKVAQHILRLYKQFAKKPRLARFVGSEGGVELLNWNSCDISCDDVIFDTENEINNTPATRQNMMFELLRAGLLYDESGKLSDTMRYKVLDVMGYGGWEQTLDVANLHINRAVKENINASTVKLETKEIDEHKLHINEHTKYLLRGDLEKLKNRDIIERKLIEHIREHKQMIKVTADLEGGEK